MAGVFYSPTRPAPPVLAPAPVPVAPYPYPYPLPPAAPGLFAPELVTTKTAKGARRGKQLQPELGSELLKAQLDARTTPFRVEGFAGLGLRLLGAYLGHRAGLGLVGVVGGWLTGGFVADRLGPPR